MINYKYKKEILENSFKLTMEIIETDNIPNEVFVWQDDKFSHVASVADMSSFDVEATLGSSFARRDNLEKEFKSTGDLEDYFTCVIALLEQLDTDFALSTEDYDGEFVEGVINEEEPE